MKKFKKIIAMGCAAVMAVSAMSMSALAAENSIEMNSEIIECTAVIDNDTSRTFSINVPSGLSETERKTYIVQAAANEMKNNNGVSAQSANGITYYAQGTAYNFSVPKNGDTVQSTEGPFTNITLNSDVCALAVMFERKTGAATSYNARFEYVNAFNSSDKRSSYLNRSATSGSCTIFFTDGATAYPDDMVVSSRYVYDLYVSANTSGGKADITLFAGVIE